VLTGNSIALGHERSIRIEGSRHIVLGPHTLDHNPDYSNETIDGVTLRNSDGCSLTGVLLEGARAGSDMEGGVLEVVNCRETSIVGCQVFEPKYRGIWVADSRNTRIADCTVMDRGRGGTMRVAIQVAGKSPGTLIRGNIVGKGKDGDIVAPGSTLEGNQPAAS
jgi:parallel beta-helix repeat protein